MVYTAKVWDQKSDINGVDAKTVKEIHNIKKGEVGIVLDERGKVLDIQYDNAVPYTKKEAKQIVEELAEMRNNPPEETTEN